MAKKKVIRHNVPEGFIIGYKKADLKIVTLLIPAEAHAIMGDDEAYTKKCRASEAKVLAVESKDGKKSFTSVKSDTPAWDAASQLHYLTYRVGRTVKPYLPFNKERARTCRSGIHFFLTRELAENY